MAACISTSERSNRDISTSSKRHLILSLALRIDSIVVPSRVIEFEAQRPACAQGHVLAYDLNGNRTCDTRYGQQVTTLELLLICSHNETTIVALKLIYGE